IPLLSADFNERSNVSFGYVYYTYMKGFSRQEIAEIRGDGGRRALRYGFYGWARCPVILP
ncbi:MAG: hypothetical protein Q7J01_03065, partial [Syntrophales bacterium]|nr:hypothetical protein [Syntrophales bacterium]